MAAGGQKKTRSERVAALELPPKRWERALVSLGRRDVLLRIGVGVLAACVLCLVVCAWNPPLSYRIGYTPSRDIVARSSFRVVDQEATDAARERARWQIRYVYAQDPEPLVRLRASLRNKIIEVMAADTYDELQPGVWADFEPPAEKDSQPSQEARRQHFQKFHDALVGDADLAKFEKDLAAALAPFEEKGLLVKLPQEPGQGNQEEIVVYPLDRPDARKVVKVSDVLVGKGAPLRDSLRKHLGSPDVADPVFEWMRRRLTDTLSLDEAQTYKDLEAAVAAVKPVVVTFEPGQVLAPAGQPLGPKQMELLRLEYRSSMADRQLGPMLYRTAAMVAIILVLFALCALYMHNRERQLLVNFRRLTMMLALAILTVALARWVSDDAWRAEIVPILLFAETMAIAYRQELALLLTGVVSLILVLGLGLGLGGLLVLMAVAATALLQLRHVRSRRKLIYVGLSAGLVAVVATFGAALVENQPISRNLLTNAARNGLWTLAAGFLMTGLLPFIESLFGILTDISLLELGDVAHPLLQELVRRAPSTYNHSITVGSIGEAAADAIGARGLLVRVGAYFHDIGKMLKPGYFVENQGSEENRHEDLVPAMSTLVIIAHIKDGANLARQHHLPESIIDFIRQHHGTTLVGYFYDRASQQSKNDPNGGSVEESAFRYPGPRPQTKEAGVLMLADAVESASRTLVDPTPARVESLVHEIAERRLDDGQFDETNLTLRELRTIENSLAKSLIAIYHGRVKYPDQRTA